MVINHRYTDYVVLKLIKKNRLLIIDQKGRKVKKIKTKRIKIKGKGVFKGAYNIRRAFINVDNGQEICSEFIKGRIITPVF